MSIVLTTLSSLVVSILHLSPETTAEVQCSVINQDGLLVISADIATKQCFDIL